MPWISAAAARSQLRDAARKHLEDQRSGAAPRTTDHMTIVYAFVGADTEVMALAAEHAEAMIPFMEKRLKLNTASETADYLNLAVAASFQGADVQPRLKRLLAAKADNDPATMALRWIAESALGEAARPRLRRAPEWLSKLVQAAPADALDMALVPDHKEWGDLESFVLPLALLLSTASKTPFATYAKDGGHPERRGEVLYERTSPRPPVQTAIDENDRATWPGFDAVEKKDDRLLVYHYLGQRWQAPIVFQPDIKALPFLSQLSLSWRLVEESVPKDAWSLIRADVEADRVTHVIAYDPEQTFVAKDAIENASREYKIRLEAADYRTI
jgi:hypothetical protein